MPLFGKISYPFILFTFYLLLCSRIMARRSSSQLRAKNAAPMASSTAAAFQGDAARNCPKAARASTAARRRRWCPAS